MKIVQNQKIAIRIGIFTAVILLVGFGILWQVIGQEASALMKQSITSQMEDAVETRTTMINEYITSAEDFLVAFGQGEQVKNVLLDASTKNIEKAQKYTEDFANVKGIFEGLYIARTDTYTLTHNVPSTIGIYCRTGEAAKEFEKSTLAKEELTNTGIIKSPSSGEMVISMYYPIFEEGRCIGYVGAAVYASKLMDILTQVKVNGIGDYEYAFINNASGVYLYNKDEALLNTEVKDEAYLKVMDEVKNHPDEENGMIEFKGKEDTDILVYHNISERNWVFLVRSCTETVYSAVIQIRNITASLCLIVALVTSALIMIVLRQVGKELTLVQKAIEKLKHLDLSANHELRAYRERKDEVGMICGALDVTCKSIKKYIEEINTQLYYMAEGDYTAQSDMEYDGDFKEIQNSMNKIQEALRNSFRQIRTVTSQLAIGSQNVSEGATNLAEVATEENSLILEIEDHVNSIDEEVMLSAKNANDAKQKSDNAAKIVNESKAAMDALVSAMNEIVESTNEIVTINSAMERIAKQTHILALNATVEASRAGEAGRGFSVVANEIRELAEKANESASMTKEIIEKTIETVQKGTDLSNQTSESLVHVVKEAAIIDASISEIAETTMMQSKELKAIVNKLSKISMVVETTAATAEQSAAASAQLDGQINELRKNIAKYRV